MPLFSTLTPQLAAEIRMSNADERVGPLAQRQAEEVHRAVFGDHPVHVATGRYDTGAWLD